MRRFESGLYQLALCDLGLLLPFELFLLDSQFPHLPKGARHSPGHAGLLIGGARGAGVLEGRYTSTRSINGGCHRRVEELFISYSLSTYRALGTVLGVGNRAMMTVDKNPCPYGTDLLPRGWTIIHQ